MRKMKAESLPDLVIMATRLGLQRGAHCQLFGGDTIVQ
jgi:hypothetical protein